MRNAFLIGTQVYLRPLERDDAPAFVTWLNDAEVSRTLRRHWPLSLRAQEDYLEKADLNGQDILLGIVLRESDRLIGGCGLREIDARDRHGSLGIVIGAKEEWGKGHGTEATRLLVQYAFATLNLNRVWLHVLASNERAIRSYERVGFQREGLLRQHQFVDGRYQDIVTMALLRTEGQSLNRA